MFIVNLMHDERARQRTGVFEDDEGRIFISIFPAGTVHEVTKAHVCRRHDQKPDAENIEPAKIERVDVRRQHHGDERNPAMGWIGQDQAIEEIFITGEQVKIHRSDLVKSKSAPVFRRNARLSVARDPMQTSLLLQKTNKRRGLQKTVVPRQFVVIQVEGQFAP